MTRDRLTPPGADVLIALVFVGLVLVEAVWSPVRSPVVHATVVGTAMAALAWRRAFPVCVAALAVTAMLVADPGDQFSPLLSLVLVSFTVGSETDPPRSHLGLGVVAVPFLSAVATQGLEPSDLAAALVFIVGPWAVGVAVRQRAKRADDAVRRAALLEHEHARQRQLAVTEERTRIARELHDIVSHSISVVAVQTQAVRRRLRPDQTSEAEALAAVEATARDAMAEMRRLFGVLRADGAAASLTPQPGLAEVDRLLDSLRDAGTTLELRVEGEPYDVQPGIDLAAYRIVQEAVTNALRHAGASKVTVLLGYAPSSIEVVVEDDGRGLGSPRAGGHGLVGIRERVHLYGGSLDIGSGSLGGVRVAARLPAKAPA